MGYYDRCELSELLGKTFCSVIAEDDDRITFTCTDGSVYALLHEQD